jgi:hypothetical protein
LAASILEVVRDAVAAGGRVGSGHHSWRALGDELVVQLCLAVSEEDRRIKRYRITKARMTIIAFFIY